MSRRLRVPSSLYALVVASVLLVAAVFLSQFALRPSTPVEVVRAYYQTTKLFDPASGGHARGQLRQYIHPEVWQCIQFGLEQQASGLIEGGPTPVLAHQCGLRETGFFQDPYPLREAKFKIVTETAAEADIEISFPKVAPEVTLRYLLVHHEDSWRIARSDQFGDPATAARDFPASLAPIIETMGGITWQHMPRDEYWYPDPATGQDRHVTGTSLFGRSTSATFADAFTNFDPLLTAAGWEQDTNVAADGVGGSILGYSKQFDNTVQRLIFSYETVFLGPKSDETPPQCPCIYTNKIFFAEETVSED